jgi:hypothetical protein
MDKLKDKHVKMLTFLASLKKNIKSFESFMNTYVKEIIDVNYSNNYEILYTNVKTLYENTEECEKSVNELTKNLIDYHKSEYTNSKKSILKYDKIFTIIKYNKHMCAICLQNEVTCFTIPCGHTYCNTCSKRINNMCFICRQPSYKINQLYYT